MGRHGGLTVFVLNDCGGTSLPGADCAQRLQVSPKEEGALWTTVPALSGTSDRLTEFVAIRSGFCIAGFLRVLRVFVVKWFSALYHHGGTENTENALIQLKIYVVSKLKCPVLLASEVSGLVFLIRLIIN